jgi:hypothetical protein
VASVFMFLLALQLLLARSASIKWILLATWNFHSPLASGHFPHCYIAIIHAACKGVYSLVSHRFTLLLHFSKLLIMSILPFIQATCKGVYPSVSHRFTLLLHFSKLLTTSIWPLSQATCKGVYPLVPHRCTLILHFSKMLTISNLYGLLYKQHVKEYIH